MWCFCFPFGIQDSESEHMHLTVPGKELSDDVIKKCIQCHATSTSQWRPAPDGTKVVISFVFSLWQIVW